MEVNDFALTHPLQNMLKESQTDNYKVWAYENVNGERVNGLAKRRHMGIVSWTKRKAEGLGASENTREVNGMDRKQILHFMLYIFYVFYI